MILSYIEEFTNPGEIILDPFGGSGNIVKTAIQLGRRAIYVDLNPFAKLVAETTITGCPREELQKAVQEIVQKKNLKIENSRNEIVEVDRELLFSVRCPCGRYQEISSILFTHKYSLVKEPRKTTVLQRKILEALCEKPLTHDEILKQISNSAGRNAISNAINRLVKLGFVSEEVIPVRVTFARPCACGRKVLESSQSLEWAIKDPVIPAFWYPKARLRYPNGEPFLKKRNAERVFEFFDSRTIAYLSYLWSQIKQLRVSPQARRCLHLIFMATLARSSKMNRPSGGTWPINSYWIPRSYIIRNPFYTFLRASYDVLNDLSAQGSRSIKASRSVHSVLRGTSNVAFLLGNAAELPLPNDTIDYILTDPPHTDDVQFFELSFFYTVWLKKRLDFANELVVNPKQGKDLTRYFQAYSNFVHEAHRVLKPCRHLTVILHEKDEKVLNSFIAITTQSGFRQVRFEKINSFQVLTFQKIENC